MTDTKPANVIEALARVMADLPGIAKTPHLAPGGKGLTYAYRGIEEITSAVQGLFAKYGIVIVPRVRHREVKDIVVNGNDWTDTYLDVDWGIYGPGDSSVGATTFGMGRDNSDKGTNKAMTQAFKYLLLELLCVSDPADDTDGTLMPDAFNKREAAPQVASRQPSHPTVDPRASGVLVVGGPNAERGNLAPAHQPAQPANRNTAAMLGRIHAVSKLLGLDVQDSIACALGEDVLEESLTFAQCRQVNDWLTAEQERGA